MRLDIYHHIIASPEVLFRLDLIIANQETIMATLDEVLADVAAESTAIDSLAALTAGLKRQVADALANTTLPPDVQAKIDAVFTGLEQNKQKVMDAITANQKPIEPQPAQPIT